MDANDTVGTLSSITSLSQTSCFIPRASLSSRSTASSSDSIKSYDCQKYHPSHRRQSDFAKVHDASIMKWNKLEEGAYSMPSSMTSIASFSVDNKKPPQQRQHQFSGKLKKLEEKTIPNTTTTITTDGMHASFSSLSQDSSSNSLHVSEINS